MLRPSRSKLGPKNKAVQVLYGSQKVTEYAKINQVKNLTEKPKDTQMKIFISNNPNA